MTPSRLLWNNSRMKSSVLILVLFTPAAAVAGQTQRTAPAQAASAATRSGEAYAQFLLGHRLAENDDEAGAVAAYKRAMEIDPQAADIPAELAGLYLQQNKIQEAMSTAEQSLKIDAANREGNRVLGIVYAAMSDSSNPRSRQNNADRSDEYVTKAIPY